jgi:hypothetical protein
MTQEKGNECRPLYPDRPERLSDSVRSWPADAHVCDSCVLRDLYGVSGTSFDAVWMVSADGVILHGRIGEL